MAEECEGWLARNSRAENAQVWSIILMPIWLPIVAAIYAYDWARRRVRGMRGSDLCNE